MLSGQSGSSRQKPIHGSPLFFANLCRRAYCENTANLLDYRVVGQ
jgi:hypothetical protein